MMSRVVEVEVAVVHGMIVTVKLVVQSGGRVFDVAVVVVVAAVLVLKIVAVPVFVTPIVLVYQIGGSSG